MLDYNEILRNLPIDQLAAQVGESPEDVQQAVQSALPALLMGMGANAQDPAGEASLRSALNRHDPTLLDGGVDVSRIDTEDGAKIAHHIFGDNEDQVINQLGGLGGGSPLIQKLLPILAPIVMAWLAGKFMGQDQRQRQPQGAPQQNPQSGGGGLGDILGQILGGGAGAPQAQPAPQRSEPNFRQPADADQDGGLRMPMPEPRTTQQPTQQAQPQGGGLGGGILGDILGGLLGGGRR